MGALSKYLGITRQFVRIGIIRKSQFRVEFLSQVVMDTIWYTSHILSFEILYRYVPEIAGWSNTDIRVFLSFLFVADAFMMIWLGQSWHFGRELKDGKLDPVRVRPASAIFLYFFQRFSLEACVNMAMALTYSGYALWQAGIEWSVGTAFVILWAVLLSWWGRSVLSVMFSTCEFYFLNSDLGHMLNHVATAPADKPLDIWGLRMKQFLLHLIPVGVLSHIPASMVLGKLTIAASLAHTAWLTAFGLLVFRFWNRSFRRYESAMS